MWSVWQVVWECLSAGTWSTGSVDASRGNPLLIAGATRLIPTSIDRPRPATIDTPLLVCKRRRRISAPVVVIELLTRRTRVIGVAVDLVEVGHGVRVLPSAEGTLLRRRSSAAVVVIERFTRNACVVGVTIDLVEVGHGVLVLTGAGSALRCRTSAPVVVIEHLITGTGVISMTRLMTIEMLTRRTRVISMTRPHDHQDAHPQNTV